MEDGILAWTQDRGSQSTQKALFFKFIEEYV